MVRLKEEWFRMFPCYALFQFHYGSVKRIIALKEDIRSELFQFHYGSVKRKPFSSNLRCFLYFNSTMVRLKVSTTVLAISLERYFNSTMVRLKANDVEVALKSFGISIPLWFG